ncbi:ankyrin repeat protein, partial [Trichoderma virens Gv29-8]
DLWYQAFQELDEKTREWIRDPSESKAENVRQWVTDLVTLIQEREEEYNDSSPKLNVRGCEIIWRDYASKAETLLATIGDIAVNFAFSLSTIICSALGKLMKTKVAQYKDLAAIFVCAEKVLSLTRRGMVYEIVYLQDASSNIATKELQKTLVDLYKALLQLLSSMPAQLIENQGWQFFQALAWSGEDAERVSVLSTHEHKLSMAIQACDTIRLTAHQKLLQSLSTPLRRVDKNVENLTVLLQKKSLDEALDYISVIPIESHHLEKRETRTPGTCEWLLQDPRFLKWEETSYSSILWLHGITGAGKSYLTSKVIDRYWFDNEKDAKHDEGFAYFYCSLSDPARRNPTSIYQSYIRQLAQLYHYPRRIHKSIFNLYYKAKREQRSLSFNECRTALSELLNSYPQTTLVLDALDECEVETRKVLMLDLNSLVTAAERPVKVYIASRMEVDIIRNLRHGSDISIDPSYGKGDIEKYIEQEMRLLSNKWKSVSESVRAKVSRTITDLGSGNFVLAYLQWEQVKKLKTNSSILRGLENLPRSLDEAYHDIYSQNNEAELVIFQRVMKWVFCAQEPLSNEQLLSAIRLEAQKDGRAEAALTTSSPITQSTLESICGNLIVRDSRLNVWNFFHASAAEYFKGYVNHWRRNAHEDVAALLISCLINCYSRWTIPPTAEHFKLWLEHKPDLDDYLDLRHPLQSYARRFWVQHARSSSNHRLVSPILKRFLGARGPQRSSSRQYRLWCRHIERNPRTMPALAATDLFPVQKSIFGICALGLHTLLEGWWEEDIDASLVNSSGMDLLSIAAKYGHHKLCSDLIKHGSDMDGTLNSVHGSALSEAIDMNHVDIAALLLDRGHNPNTYSDGKILLCIAVERAEWAVPMLLKAKADPNISCQRYNSALVAAVSGKLLRCVRFLINHGADVNALLEHGMFGSALAAVACRKSLGCLQLLLEHGADVNSQLKCGDFGTALAAAVFGWSEDIEIVKYLVEEAGADTGMLSSN